ncbi:hypothetical protein BASA83_005429 [Batrachochytrium salamandrivorans]|nr:hypothetical protein BASA81_009766 [Batrachochytrium salamandrivorans]KAH9272336.1 hypothetical protein BASA83_005429 [Batrachochytrium salamandrivorans]
MKFNALVVAAMVITSVSAGGRKGLPGWLRGSGMTGSGSSYDTFDNDPEPPSQQVPSKNEQVSGSSHDPPMSGSMPGLTHDPPLIDFDSELSQDSPENDFGPVVTQETLLIDLVSDYPQGPPENVPRLELSQIPQVRGSGSGLPHNLMDDDLVPFQEPEPTNKESVCSSIEAELPLLWDRVYALNREFYRQMSRFYSIITMREGKYEEYEKSKKGKKSKKDKKDKKDKKEKNINLKDQQIRAWLELNPGAIPDLQGIKAKYDDYEANRDGILERLNENKCPPEFTRVSLEEMVKQGSLPKWKDDNGVNFLSDQWDYS